MEKVADPPPAPQADATASPVSLPAPGNSAKLSPADLRQMLVTAGDAHNLDVDLLASLVKAESNGNEQGQDELPHPNQRKVRIDGIRTKASADAVVFG